MNHRVDAVKKSKELRLGNSKGQKIYINNKSTRIQVERDRPMKQALKEVRDKYKGDKKGFRSNRTEKVITIVIEGQNKVVAKQEEKGYAAIWLISEGQVNNKEKLEALKERTPLTKIK